MGVKLSVQEKALGFNEEGEIIEIKPEEEIEEEIIDQETQKEQPIGQDDLAEEEPLEEIAYYEPAEIIFRIKEKGAENWFYENTYYFDQAAPSHLYPFGFPIIEESESKTYLVELAGKKQPDEETPALYVFASVDKNNQPYLYSRYVYNKGELKNNIGSIWENILKKVSKSINNGLSFSSLATLFLTLETVVYFYVSKNTKTKTRIIKIMPYLSLAALIIIPCLNLTILNRKIIIEGFLIILFFISSFFLKKGAKQPNWIIIALLFLTFISNQTSQITTADIGSDEGHSLYAIRMMKEELNLYDDFWFREPGSLLMIRPFFSFLKTTIKNQRTLVVFYQILFLALNYLIIKKATDKKSAFLFLAISSIFSKIINPINLGLDKVFFQIFSITSVSLFFLYLKKNIPSAFFISSIIVAISTFTYKGGLLIFLSLFYIEAVRYLKDEERFSKILLYFIFYFLSSGLIILLFNLLGSPINNLITYVWNDVILYQKISLVLLVTIPVVKTISKKFKIKSIVYLSWMFSSVGLFLYIAVTSQLFKNSFISSFWPNTVLENGYFSILIFFLIFLISRKRLLEKSSLILLFIYLFYLSLISVGTEKFVYYNFYCHIIALLTFLLALFLLLKGEILKKKNEAIKDENIIFLSIILNFSYFAYYVRLLSGGSSPNDINHSPAMMSFLFPLVISFLSPFLTKAKTAKPFAYLLFASLLFSNIISQTKKVDNAVVYSYQDLQEVVEFVNKKTSETDLIFTADTALAAEVRPTNILKITSPWVYRDTGVPFFCQEGDNAKFCFSKKEIAVNIQEQRPRYVVGSGRITSWTFLEESFDQNNSEINQTIKENYRNFATINKFTLYEVKYQNQ
ncbi:MAG: hypothetical protein ACOX5S_00820 [Patescibacteria group bacterium]